MTISGRGINIANFRTFPLFLDELDVELLKMFKMDVKSVKTIGDSLHFFKEKLQKFWASTEEVSEGEDDLQTETIFYSNVMICKI